MENQPQNNMQQEIIESFAKKVNELDKRQSKIETLELESLPQQMKEMDKSINELRETKTLDFSNQLSQYGELLIGVKDQVTAIPKEIPVKTKIEFDTKAKFVIKVILGLSLAVVTLTGVVVALFVNVSHRADDENRYKVVKGFYPEVSHQVDSAYVVNKDSLLEQAEINIEHQKQVLEAEYQARQAEESSKTAKKQLNELRKQHKKR
ncbi:hypothetical protein HH214_18400 [Mucilaginibacter robiniae]|uniref:Uncharacterized protein n=1 Tax=Mucilaginibacter robiniae TaxID=2728022 RepID=A0A7L5E9X8_9SPHI|nr:hypothetical protein [Mucilaginibacter robiniae]QJD97703.1 hypothetical protein HH214_18400 [Mucilaginibacter robiniae]